MAGANGSARWTDALLDRMRELGGPVADAPVAAVLERGRVDGGLVPAPACTVDAVPDPGPRHRQA